MEKTLALSEKAMMSERMQEASAASVPEMAPEGYFPDDLLLLDFPSDTHRPPAMAAVGGHQGLLFEELLDPSVDSLVGLSEAGVAGGDEEEELEWLSNKDAFPAVETSFEILPSHSRSSSGSAAVADGPSPISVLVAAAAASFPVPVRPRSKGLRRRGRVLTGLSPGPARVTPAVRRAAAAAAERRRCRHCGAEETPQWRAGPEGPKTLCNACGVRYKSGRLVPEYRPASSPTFSPAIHSNSHRRILEMRRRKAGSGRRSSRKAPPHLLTSSAM